jgi:FkbM family methyltransferase
MSVNNIQKYYNAVQESYKRILGDKQFTVVDIGARGGVGDVWEKVKDIVHFVLIEPEKEQALKLEKGSNDNVTVIPKAIWQKTGEYPFYITRNRSYCSMLEPNDSVLEGNYYYDRNFYHIDKVKKIQAYGLQSIMKEYEIPEIDFIKIDIQGGEMKVLNTIEQKYWDKIQGIKSEAYAAQLYKNGANISEILSLLYKNNLELFDLETIHTSPITSSCGQELFAKNILGARPNCGYKGRSMVFDLLLLKDRLDIIKSDNENIIRKAIFTSCVFEYFDRAFDLILRAEHNKIMSRKSILEIKQCIKVLYKKSLSFIRLIKEKVKIRSYQLKKR